MDFSASLKLTRMKVLHCKMELTFWWLSSRDNGVSKPQKGKSNDQRKPSGYAKPVKSFPPKKTLPTIPASDRAVKRQWMVKNNINKPCRCEEGALPDAAISLLIRRLLRTKTRALSQRYNIINRRTPYYVWNRRICRPA